MHVAFQDYCCSAPTYDHVKLFIESEWLFNAYHVKVQKLFKLRAFLLLIVNKEAQNEGMFIFFHCFLLSFPYGSIFDFMEILKVESRSHNVHHAHGEEEKVMTRKQKAESKAHEVEHSPKKAKVEDEKNGHTNGKSASDVVQEYDEFCKATNEQLSLDQMKEILEANGLDSSGSDLEITRSWLVIEIINSS